MKINQNNIKKNQEKFYILIKINVNLKLQNQNSLLKKDLKMDIVNLNIKQEYHNKMNKN